MDGPLDLVVVLLGLVHLQGQVLEGDAPFLLLLQRHDHLLLPLVLLLNLQQTHLQVLVLLFKGLNCLQVGFVALLQVFGGLQHLLRLDLVAL